MPALQLHRCIAIDAQSIAPATLCWRIRRPNAENAPSGSGHRLALETALRDRLCHHLLNQAPIRLITISGGRRRRELGPRYTRSRDLGRGGANAAPASCLISSSGRGAVSSGPVHVRVPADVCPQGVVGHVVECAHEAVHVACCAPEADVVALVGGQLLARAGEDVASLPMVLMWPRAGVALWAGPMLLLPGTSSPCWFEWV